MLHQPVWGYSLYRTQEDVLGKACLHIYRRYHPTCRVMMEILVLLWAAPSVLRIVHSDVRRQVAFCIMAFSQLRQMGGSVIQALAV